MKTIEQLYNWFYLDKRSSNSQISDWSKPLRVAPIKKVKNYEKIEIDYKHFAFAEKNEYFHGLKNFLRIEKIFSHPIFIFDNHNHAITFRYNIIYSKKINNVKLVHIDQHSDNRENKYHLKLNQKGNEIEKIFNFCNKKCNVWNFIPPALENKIITDQIQIRSTATLQNLEIDKSQNFILDIDLDFCLDWIDRNKINEETIKILKKIFNKTWKYALWITIATSPYFINQKIAIDIIEKLLVKW